jgi:Sulfotransferase domain
VEMRSRLRPLLVRYRHVAIRAEDVLLASYPRSGSTWLRCMLFDYLTGGEADFDAVDRAIPYVGRQRGAAPLLHGGGRMIKTHELYRAGARRAIYLVRDIRAVLPSMFRQQKRAGYRKDLDTFLDEFLEGDVGPFGSWAEHVAFWTGPNPLLEKNLLEVRFEDMKTEPAEALHRILDYIGVEAEASRMKRAILNNDLAAMKRREQDAPEAAILNRREDLPFVGQGTTEGWRQLEPAQVARVEQAAGEVMRRMGYAPITQLND